jgi:hypothetical protein
MPRRQSGDVADDQIGAVGFQGILPHDKPIVGHYLGGIAQC